jgi:ribose transport system ATP-binding protein
VTTPRLVLRGLRKSFGGFTALDGVDLQVDGGQILALLGENGAGKSTLIKCLAGAYTPDAGNMWLDGEPYAPASPRAAAARGVAVVHQELSLFPHLTVAENLVPPANVARWGWVSRRRQRSAAAAACARLGIELPLDATLGELPPAARQLAEIARAVGGEQPPRLLILDEPTSSLAADDAERLLRLVERLRDQGVAIIYISHALEECRRLAGPCVILRDGASVADGPLAELDEASLLRHLCGRTLDEAYPRSARTPGAPLLELSALVPEKSAATAASGASLTLHAGEIVGIFGLVGAGRTELLRCMFGLDAVDSGSVLMAGQPATHSTPRHRWAAGVGFLSEDRKLEGLALGLDLADNLTATRLAPYAQAGWLSPRRQASATASWMPRLGVRARGARQCVGELSGGNQQKIAFGRLLHHDCRILLLDEPTRGIDVGAKAALYSLMDAQAAAGRAILLVSSYLPELLGVCDRIAVMNRGTLGPARPTSAWSADALLAAALHARPTTATCI